MTTESNTYTLAKTIEDKDIYKAILDTRNFEISLFWQRSNYFLALNSALAIGFFTQKPSKLTLLLSALGVISSFLWYLVMLGSKYWQSRWEDKLSQIETKVAPDLKAFAADRTETDESVRRSLSVGKHAGFHLWLDGQIIKKPSVSLQMTSLSFIFILGWSGIFAWAISQGAWSASDPVSSTTQGSQSGSSPPSGCPVTAQPLQCPAVNANPSINIAVTTPDCKSPRPSKAKEPPASPPSNCR
jgi:hypothetical protein